jgi:hypothetical protein
MRRACDSIEKTRDLKNHLFLVGPAARPALAEETLKWIDKI